MVGFGDIVHHDVFQSGLGGSAGNDLGRTLGVSIHGAIADDESRVSLIARQTIVDVNNLLHILVPHRAVGRADVIHFDTGKFLQCHLHGSAVLAHDVGIV